MSLTVKAYLEKEGKQDGEIRRFAIPGDVTSSFAYLSKKIADIFPSLRDGNFTLFWKDPDGDMVLFSTDEEQMEALGFVTDSLFKVFVKVKDNKKSAPKPQEPEGQLHPGVVCDGCDGGIRGNRFKCVTCPDYDLCSVCEQKGVHTEHNMVKITQPAFATPGGPFWACGPPPPGPPHMGPRHGHPRPGEPFAPPPHFRRWMRKFMKRWHHKNSAGCSNGYKDDSPDDDERNCDEAYLKSVGESVAAMLDPMGIDVHVDVDHGGKRHCRGAGQGHRLGGRGKGRGARANRDCMFRDESLKRKCPNKKQSGNSDQEKEKSDDSSMEADKTTTTIDLTTDGQAAPAQTEAEMTDELAKQTEKIALQDDNDQDVTLIKETEVQPVETAPRMDIQNGNKDHVDNSWTFITPPTSQPGPVGPPAPQPSHVALPPTQMTPMVPAEPIAQMQAAPMTQVQAPPLVSVPAPPPRSVQFQMPPQVVYPPQNAHIAQALEQMLAMGFNNDGGWLLRLLEAKNGDIIQVLDAIKPQPGRSRETNGGYRA